MAGHSAVENRVAKAPCYRVSGFTGRGVGIITHWFSVRAQNQKDAVRQITHSSRGTFHGERVRQLIAVRCTDKHIAAGFPGCDC